MTLESTLLVMPHEAAQKYTYYMKIRHSNLVTTQQIVAEVEMQSRHLNQMTLQYAVQLHQ